MNQDLEHLRLLSIFHYVVAALTALFACFPIIHLIVGSVIVFASPSAHHAPNFDAMQRLVGFFFIGIASVMILAGWTLAVCTFIAGKNLALRRRYTFCLVIAALLCAFMPFGTVLGVFTIIVLVRPSVKALFQQTPGIPPDGLA